MLGALANSGSEVEVIGLGIVTNVVLGKLRQVRMLRPHTAHARSKKKKQKGESNHGYSLCVLSSY